VRPYPEAHFAVYPPELVEMPINAGCPENGVVLDPFIGSGTTALVARQLGRHFVGIELNPAYVRQARQRLAKAA
jgi:DNA modification methylase